MIHSSLRSYGQTGIRSSRAVTLSLPPRPPNLERPVRPPRGATCDMDQPPFPPEGLPDSGAPKTGRAGWTRDEGLSVAPGGPGQVAIGRAHRALAGLPPPLDLEWPPDHESSI